MRFLRSAKLVMQASATVCVPDIAMLDDVAELRGSDPPRSPKNTGWVSAPFPLALVGMCTGSGGKLTTDNEINKEPPKQFEMVSTCRDIPDDQRSGQYLSDTWR